MEQLPVSTSISVPKSPTLRDWAAVGFRNWRISVFSFFLIFAAVAVITLVSPPKYEAELKILVKHERPEAPVTAEPEKPGEPLEVTEEDLNSEVELLKSRDLLQKVASSGVPAGNAEALYRATVNLEKNLTVEPLRKTKLIKVTYRGTSPAQAESVLQSLSHLYFEKHLEVHRLPGALDFLQTQADRYRTQLSKAETALKQFANDNGVVEAPLSRELTVRKQKEFEADLDQSRAAVAETEQRIHALEQQEKSTSPRLTTSVRTSANPLLLQQLRSTLLSLQLKKTELLSQYKPDYRPVREVETQIEQAREALDNAEKNPVREETTDRDATHEWLKSELAKSRAELKGLQTKVAETTQIVGGYHAQARKLNDTEITHQDLVREAKTAEENFLLYSRQREQARISDALDQQRIVNVSVAQPPTAPPVPAGPSRTLNLALGFLLALLISIAVALTLDYTDRSFRTPDEVEIFLNVPVLAAVPTDCDSGELI